jgi:protein involved in polysaccharide export with SLBB domain
MFLRLLRGAWHTRRLLSESAPCLDTQVLEAASEAARRIGIETPNVRFSGGVSSPTVFAFGRGTLLLPTTQTTTQKIDALPAVFCHELGHIRRRDGWNRLAIEVAVVLLPWQPLMWLLRREFLHHAEEACDDWAVAAGADPVALASILADFVPSIPRPHLGAAIMTTDAKTRILRLLALRETPRPRTPRVKFVAVLVAATIVGAGVALAQPKVDEKSDPTPQKTKDASAVEPESEGVPNSVNAKRELTGGPQVKAGEKFVYLLEPPDVVSIEPVRLVSKAANRVEPFDRVRIDVYGTITDAPIKGDFTVDGDGEVNLGPPYGRVAINGIPVKEAEQKIEKHLGEILSAPDVALVITGKNRSRFVSGQAAIEPDGYIRLGDFGRVYVSGMTVDEAREAIEKKLSEYFEDPEVALNIHAHHSKVYYVIVEGNDTGDNITRYPWNGSENVLDAIAQQKDLLIRKDSKIWIARPMGDKFEVLNIDWAKLKTGEISPRRFRLIPGDRVFVAGATWKSASVSSTNGKRS